MKLALQIVTWNSSEYIADLFASLRKSNLHELDCELFILDNASVDNTVEVLHKEVPAIGVPYKIIKEKQNTGFSGGHNRLFALHNSEYLIIINPDIIFEPDCIRGLVQFLDQHPEIAALAPRLMRSEQSTTVDSLGLQVFRNRRVVEIGAGQSWQSVNLSFRPERSEVEKSGSAIRYDKNAMEVFGLSGACAMYRTEALRSVAFADGYFFDETYGSYKEDVDLSFRLLSAGYRSCVLLNKVGYHRRSAKGLNDKSDEAAAKNKEKQSKMVKYNSYKNHLLTLYKNEYWQNLMIDFPLILWYELKKFVYLLLFDQVVLKGLMEVWKKRKELLKKQAWIREKRKVSWKELRKWWKQ
ncbi:MAG: glycosyltransferase family 2 protein [Candidatus Magasanikbacteria bacterium]|nr:glycosyltransferase family 2 protein [Candidatus Magasanikbacteria bacterium]